MLNSKVKAVCIVPIDDRFSKSFIETDQGFFRITGEGYYLQPDMPSEANRMANILPERFRDKEVLEVRCNGEAIMIRLEDDGFIDLDWTISTASGVTTQEVVFHPNANADPEILEFYNDLDACTSALTNPETAC